MNWNWERASDIGRPMRREGPIGTNPDLVLLTAPGVEQFLRLPADELNEMIRDGRIRGGFRLGRYWRFRRPVVEQFIHEQKAEENRRCSPTVSRPQG